MRKPWSISTTVRNPLRLRDFLLVLASLEGQPFDNDTQILYQVLLIKNRLYKPMNLTRQEKALYQNIEQDFPLVIARTIFERQQYEDPAMRGRQSANPLNKLGFAVARGGLGNVRITELGRKFIGDESAIEEIFLRSLLKLQFPNPWSSEFSTEQGFNIRPLVATLCLLKAVQERFGGNGLTSTEFSLLIPTLIHHQRIDSYLDKLNEYRESQNKKAFILAFAREFYGHTPSAKELSNLFEYGDNIMRYFRMTKLFRVTRSSFRAEWRIGLEPLRMSEIDRIIESLPPDAIEFATPEEYLEYLSDINQPHLDLSDRSVLLNRIGDVKKYLKEVKETVPPALKERIEDFVSIDIEAEPDLESTIERGRSLTTEVEAARRKSQLRHNIDKLREIIETLSDARLLRKLEPEEFEFLVAQSLLVINDETLIKPNYLVDDVGQPISHATGNRPDIEGYYANFDCIVEVTKDSSSFQWVRETAPVMRHLRDFENGHTGREAFCLFIAPRIHEDTAHHFWSAIQHGYDGRQQKIIPITVDQYLEVLNFYLAAFEHGEFPTHESLQSLLRELSVLPAGGHTAWINSLPTILQTWGHSL